LPDDERYYREVYIGETKEHIRELNRIFLHLEKNPEDREAIEEALRIMHTIKGDSAILGLGKISNTAHRAEDVLAAVRDKKTALSTVLIDSLIQSVDEIEEALRSFEAESKIGKGIGVSFKELESAIEKIDANVSGALNKIDNVPKASDVKKGSLSQPEFGSSSRSSGTFRIRITNNFEALLKPMRAFIILKELAECGDLIETDPPNASLADGNYGETIYATVSTSDLGTMIEALKKIPGVVSVEAERVEGSMACEAKISAGEKLIEIDRLVSCVEIESKEQVSAKMNIDLKGRHRMEEIKVSVSSLDRLFNLAGELVLAKSRLGNIVKLHEDDEIKDIQRMIDSIVSDLQNEVMGLRLIPIGQVFGIFPRTVRDMAKELGKEIDLIIEGGETAVDRKIVEEIVDPIVHIIRNCVDHGIEMPEERIKEGKNAVGTIRIRASRDSSHFILDIEDDGRGIDPKFVKETAVSRGLISRKKAESITDEEAIYLIFTPGFSTKKAVTSLSGRGMGMSAVKSKIEAMGGSILLSSCVGSGTKVSIRLPASMVTMKIIVVGVKGQPFAIPVAEIVEIVEVGADQIRFIQGAPCINLRGDIIRLHRLAWLLGIEEGICKSYFAVIIRRGDGKSFGLLVSEVRDEDEVAMKPLPKLLRGIKGFLGATILGDGKPTFIIDVMSIV